jgi:hypothetical protein
MRQPKPFTVIQNGKPIFTIHACSLEKILCRNTLPSS